MKCLQCQNEVSDNAKFCTRCGFSFANAQPHMTAPSQQPISCTKCGNSIAPGMKFCTVCGTPVGSTPTPAPIPQPAPVEVSPEPEDEATMVLEEEPEDEATMVLEEEPEDEATMVLEEEPEDEATMVLEEEPQVQQPIQQPQPQMQPQMPPQMQQQARQPQIQPQAQQPIQQPQPQAATPAKAAKSNKSGTTVVIAIVAVAVILVAVVGVLFWKGIIKLPSKNIDTEVEEAIADENATDEIGADGNSLEQDGESTDETVDVESLVADADANIESAKPMMSDDAQLLDAMSLIRSSLDQYVEIAGQVGEGNEVLGQRIDDAYDLYGEGVSGRVDFLNAQTMSGSIYAQAMSELNEVIDYADVLSDVGYSVDTTAVTTVKDEFDTDYRKNMIETFNEFSTREQWSRTEAWNLMSSADQMCDEDDMNDPIRTRYEFALAYYIQKEAETQVNNGTITAKGAAQKIAGVIAETDYNLMLVNEYCLYMEAAGEDYTDVLNAYSDAINHIYETQNIEVTPDNVYYFWSFNSFDDYSSTVQDGDYNGLTNDNRTYIRNLFSEVSFTE